MARKKLKVEVELDTSDARRQLKGIESGGSSGNVSSGITPASSRASRQIRDLGNSAQDANVNLKAAGKAFAGMAVGLAAGYAAKNMKPGTSRDAVEYGGAAVGGAAMGMMFGPVGAAIGALGGILKTYIDKSSERDEMAKDYKKGESIYRASRAQMKKFENITDPRKNPQGIAENIPEMKTISGRFKKITEELLDEIEKELKKAAPDKEKINDLKRNVDWYRGMSDRYDKAIEDIELNNKTARASMTGSDSLAKVGGTAYRTTEQVAEDLKSATSRSSKFSFGFSVPSVSASTMTFGNPLSGNSVEQAIKTATERSAKIDEEISATLKTIADNTKGTHAWQ